MSGIYSVSNSNSSGGPREAGKSGGGSFSFIFRISSFIDVPLSELVQMHFFSV